MFILVLIYTLKPLKLLVENLNKSFNMKISQYTKLFILVNKVQSLKKVTSFSFLLSKYHTFLPTKEKVTNFIIPLSYRIQPKMLISCTNNSPCPQTMKI